MPRSYIPIDKLGAEGLRQDQPSTSKMWRELTNLRRGTGGWKRRPGLTRIVATLPSSVDLGLPKIVYTYTPAAVTLASEKLFPISSSDVAWTVNGAATAWEAVDDAVSDDDASYVNTSTTGAEFALTFAAPTTAFVGIHALRLKIRVNKHATRTNTFSFWVKDGSTYHQFGNQASYSVSAGTGYVEFSVDSSTNPITDVAWTIADLAALTIYVRKGAASEITSDVDTLSGFPATLDLGNQSASATSGVFPSTPLDTVNTAVIRATVSNTPNENSASIVAKIDNVVVAQINLQPRTSVNTTIFLFTGQAAAGKRIVFSVNHITNGQTGLTFATISNVVLTRTGLDDDLTADARITSMNLTVEGQSEVDQTEHMLFITTKDFWRYSGDLSQATDIQGGVLDPTAGENAFWDLTIFQDKLYIANGTDPLMQYPASTGVEEFDVIAGIPIGETIATYTARLVMGAIFENGVRSPSRVRWCAINAPTDWSSQTAGNLELNETRGRVLKLQPLVEAGDTLVGVLAAYKEQGIYHITPTETAADPFRKKLMDGSAGMIAPASLVGFSDRNGREAHAFLGHVGGTINVLAWNGGQVQQFGWEVQDTLYTLGDIVNLKHAVGTVDSFGNYVLLFPTTDARFLRTALVYNFNNKVWSIWEVGNVTAVGQWRPSTGRPITVFGRPDGLPYKLDEDSSTDDFESQDDIPVEAVWLTGDIALAGQEFWREATLQRIWVFYQKGSDDNSLFTFDVSTDGGDSFRVNESDLTVTSPLGQGSGISLALIDTRITARKVAIRMVSDLEDGHPEPIQIVLETEISGNVPQQQN